MAKALELYYHDNGRYPGYPNFYYYAMTTYGGAECGYTNAWCDLEDALSPYMSTLPRDTGDYRYTYKTNESGDMYGLGVALDGTHATAVGDGGFNATIYEVGPMVGYCMNKYSGSGGNWRHWSLPSVCSGGP
jgi:hypothetical protein